MNAGQFVLRENLFNDDSGGGASLVYLGQRELMEYYVDKWRLASVTGKKYTRVFFFLGSSCHRLLDYVLVHCKHWLDHLLEKLLEFCCTV